MGKMKIGSGESSQRVPQPQAVEVQTVPNVIIEEVEHIVEIPKPITKEVIVEIPKPSYKIVEVEEVVQKPKIKIEEVQQSVIKPIFTIKQETIILDQLQKKLEETVAIASNKLQVLNIQAVEHVEQNDRLQEEVEQLKKEIDSLKLYVAVSIVAGVIAAVASLLG